MGQEMSGSPGRSGNGSGEKPKKKKFEPRPPPSFGRGKKRGGGSSAFSAKVPTITPHAKCKLRLAKLERVKDWLLLEQEYITNQEALRPVEEKTAAEREAVDELRGSPMAVGSLSEVIDDSHAIVASAMGPEYYVSIMSFVDKDLLEPSCSVLLHNKTNAIVGVLGEDDAPGVNVMKVEKRPVETYADVGGLSAQIQEIKEAVELPLTHPELYEELGIKPPKGVILYGPPGTGKTLLAKAVANETSASFLRVVGSELIQKYAGEGPKLVRELFRTAKDMAPSIVFIDEIDAVGTKRYDTQSGGEKEIQRTMLELLNQLDGFDDRGDVRVIMATNRIDSLDPAIIRPGRIDRKIEFPMPDAKTKRRIFGIQTAKMNLALDVDLDSLAMSKEELSGADVKAVCSEAGLLALRERTMQVRQEHFLKAMDKVLYRKKEKLGQLYL
jgi:26S proteasome regulatory subunit T2